MSHATPNNMEAGKPGLFDDLESDFDGGVEKIGDRKEHPERGASLGDFERITLGANKTVATLARFPCSKCHGSGLYDRGRITQLGHGKCNRCRGTGLQKTDPKAAAERRAKKEEKRLADLARRILAFKEAHPEVFAWLEAKSPNFGFAASLFDALKKWGSLTDGQLAAAQRCVENDKTYEARKAAAAAERAAQAPSVAGEGFTKMVEAFARAMASGLRSPKFHVGEFTFAPAKKYPGTIYVAHTGKYLGKIDAAGKFFCSRECTSQEKGEVEQIGRDPLAAAVLHGKKTGRCSCCGRGLENEESVELGIGPICRTKWGL